MMDAHILKYEDVKKVVLSGKNKIKMVQLLKLSDCDLKNRLLQDSIIKNDLDVLSFLIPHSIKDGDVNIGNYNNICLIHIAAQYNNVDALKLLIKKGADINNKNNTFLISPMHIAINRGSVDIVKELIKYGADINLSSNISESIRHDVKKVCVNCKNLCCIRRVFTPLQYAIYMNNHRIVRLLLTHGAVLNNSKDIKSNVLFMALFNTNQTSTNQADIDNSTEIIKDLIKSGAELNIVSDCEMATPLYQAVFINNLEVVNLLIEYGADVNLSKRYNECPLTNASQFGYLPIVMTLIRHGANVNNVDLIVSISPLYMASQNNHLDVVIELIKNGATINHMTAQNSCPLSISLHKGNYLIVNYLLANGANISFYDITPHIKKLKELQVCSYRECTNERVSTCSACNIQGYCSKACQKLDWPIHKKVCKLLK
jgi:ankyrin repeat protein